jgi:hypothetical protein
LKKIRFECKILGFYGVEDSIQDLLGCDPMKEDGGSKALHNVGILLQHYMTLQARRP